ncbi:hypothetical protein [Nocardia goodfellowii]|uniref:Transposase-like protein n=1 Tax=Nocardia goodfellowii TaxID=882446 RepID=A0ABS4QS64_9NOCA|nr:hypothetical protein [Nocardia goodfellowii]MBP2194383.1 transposase-like protein [Nocardia goodfellowii]
MPKRYSPQVREEAVRRALAYVEEHGSAYAAAKAVGPAVGVHYETLWMWTKQALSERAWRARVQQSGVATPPES